MGKNATAWRNLRNLRHQNFAGAVSVATATVIDRRYRLGCRRSKDRRYRLGLRLMTRDLLGQEADFGALDADGLGEGLRVEADGESVDAGGEVDGGGGFAGDGEAL